MSNFTRRIKKEKEIMRKKSIRDNDWWKFNI